jgi:multicomponent Na+:H+ antiporter subunit B
VTRTGFRASLFLASGAGLTLLLVWGTAGLRGFGRYAGPYGDIVSHLARPQRQMANAVTATVFDYRGFDTLGEELILLAAASATALLLREVRQANVEGVVDGVRSDAVRGAGVVSAVVVFVLGLQVVAHGFLTPGGGFQGGVVLAAAFVLVFLAVEYRAFARLTRSEHAESAEGLGAAAFVGLALLAPALGLAFLQNFLPHGTFGRVLSGGSGPLVNWASGVAVAGAFLVVFGEYLQEAMAARHGRDEDGE